MRDENARLGVETTTRSDLTASQSPDRADRSVSGMRPALTGMAGKGPTCRSKDGEQFTDRQTPVAVEKYSALMRAEVELTTYFGWPR